MRKTPPRRVLAGIALVLIAGLTAGFALTRYWPSTRPRPAGQIKTVKLAVEADGIYAVPAAVLQDAGFDLANADPRTLALSVGGRPVPFQVTGQGSQRMLEFYGQTLDAQAHTARNIYWLESGAEAGQNAAVIATRAAGLAPGSAPVTVVTDTVRAEEQRQWVSQAGPGQDRWVWQTVFAPKPAQVNLSLPHATSDPAALRIRVWGNSSAPANPDHHWVLSLNGTQIADVAWEGAGEHFITATVPAGVVRPGDNELTIRPPGDTGAPVDSVFLDWIETTYTRELAADGPVLVFSGTATGYAVRPKEPPVAIWDITDPDRSMALKDYRVEGGDVRFGAPTDGALRRFAVVGQTGLLRPAAVEQPTPAETVERLHNWPGGADLIVVTVPQFRDALEPLVKARQAQGLRVAVIDVGEAYDTFSYGRIDPAAIQALIQEAIAHWTPPAPRYLLLAGDASYDPRGYLKGAEADWVPTQLVDTAFTGWTASDVWFALAPGVSLAPGEHPQAAPALAVGRLPAQTPEQLAAMVNKILAYEQDDPQAAWRRQALLVADNDDAAFAEDARAFADSLTGYSSDVVTVDKDGAARTRLLKAFGDGTGLIGYFGHGSLSLWAQEKVFSVEDVAKLSNKDRLPLVLTLTCLSGFFQHPTTVSLGESLLRAPNGGAAAVIAPSSASTLDLQNVLAQDLTQALSSPDIRTIGDALHGAQTYLVDVANGTNETLLTFNLLGDPAMNIR